MIFKIFDIDLNRISDATKVMFTDRRICKSIFKYTYLCAVGSIISFLYIVRVWYFTKRNGLRLDGSFPQHVYINTLLVL